MSESGSPLDRLEREAASAGASAEAVNVLAGDYTDCGGKLPAATPHGKMISVSLADLNSVICPTPEPEPPAAVVAQAKPEPKAAKSRGKSK